MNTNNKLASVTDEESFNDSYNDPYERANISDIKRRQDFKKARAGDQNYSQV